MRPCEGGCERASERERRRERESETRRMISAAWQQRFTLQPREAVPSITRRCLRLAKNGNGGRNASFRNVGFGFIFRGKSLNSALFFSLKSLKAQLAYQ